MKRLITLFLNFSAAVLFCLWNVFSESFWFGRWLSRVLMIDSESIWSFNCGKKSLNKWTWGRYNLVWWKKILTVIWCFPQSLKSPVDKDSKCSDSKFSFDLGKYSWFDCGWWVTKYTSPRGSFEKYMSKHEMLVWKIASLLKVGTYFQVFSSCDHEEAKMNVFLLFNWFFPGVRFFFRGIKS